MRNFDHSDSRFVSGRRRSGVIAASLCAVAVLCAVGWPASVAVAADPRALLDLSLDQLSKIKIDTVYAASKFTQKVTDAPSSVTIVTGDQIQRFGYRTLAEIIRSQRSFDVTSDRNYSYTGVRGFTSLGDFGSRTLLLIDGHRMNDPIFDTAAVGTEGFLDVDLIERVEFIRGPGSSIYGSNAFFAVINVVTRSGASVDGVEASVSGGSFDTFTGRATIGKKLANGLEYFASASAYFSNGPERLYFKEFDSPETNFGIAKNQAGGEYWSTFGKVSWGDFTLQGGYVTRDKDVPTAPSGTVFNVPNLTVNSRGYVELRYSHETSNGWSLTGRVHYDAFDFRGAASYDYDSGRVVNIDEARAQWVGAEAGVSRTFFKSLRLAAGGEVRHSLDLRQRNFDEEPFNNYLDVTSSQLVLGAYADGHLDITSRLSLAGGVRYDNYDSFGSTVNPRTALTWKPLENTTLKLLYGEAFRAPNIYQLDYTSFRQRANPALQPETIRSYEIVAEQYFLTHWRGSVSLFRNEISSLIDTTADRFGFISFTNATDAEVNGVEGEIEGKWDNGLLLRASYAYQKATIQPSGQRLVNAPDNVVKGQVSVPLFRDKLFGSLELLYSGDRVTLDRASTGDTVLLNGTLYSRNLLPGLDFSASVYNILGQKYRTPGGVENLQDTITQDGRTFRLKLGYQF